jgi:transcription antitermination factor NusB
MRKRTQAREIALQILYQLDLLEGDVPEAQQARFLSEHAEGPDVREYARTLIQGTLSHRAEIDRTIEEVAKNWELGRMAIIDRNILRMAIYEILYRDDIPPKVAINEAVDLAKKYSTKNSSAFVNGILDKVKERRPSRGPEPAPEPDIEPPPARGEGERDGSDRDEDEDARS